jgi:hypothetical protein
VLGVGQSSILIFGESKTPPITMLRHLFALVLFEIAAVCCVAEEVTVSRNVIMRSSQSMASVKAGTVVELVSRNEKEITIRYKGQEGTIPADSVYEKSPLRAPVAAPDLMPTSSSPVTPAIILGPRTLFLENSTSETLDSSREYIPDDENSEHWLHKASNRVLENLGDPRVYLDGIAADAKKANPRSHSRFLTDGVLELVYYCPPTFTEKFVQWSLTRATHIEGKGLVVHEYAVRYFNYGDATSAMMDAERNAVLEAFLASRFDEVTGNLKPHDVSLGLATDATVSSFFPGGTFYFTPRISLEFVGYTPDELELPAVTSKDGHMWCIVPMKMVLFDSKGTAVPLGGGYSYAPMSVTATPVTLKEKGAFRVQFDNRASTGFRLTEGGVYRVVIDCYLKDSRGKAFVLSDSREVVVVDTRAPDRSLDPAYRP